MEILSLIIRCFWIILLELVFIVFFLRFIFLVGVFLDRNSFVFDKFYLLGCCFGFFIRSENFIWISVWRRLGCSIIKEVFFC